MKVILASASPRRKELLEQIGLAFEVIPAKGEEILSGTDPKEAVLALSKQKAEEIAKMRSREHENAKELVIGADTVVSFDGRILGKPEDSEAACQMLSMLQGQTHKVYTGVTLILREGSAWNARNFYEMTEVMMYPMSREELRWYIETGEPFDKAGGYGIQGRCAVFIRGISGDYNNVVGLPVARLYQELQNMGMDGMHLGRGV